MAHVSAPNPAPGELMAVKQISYGGIGAPSESALHTAQALQREVACLQALSHPNIVRYLGVERDDVSGHVSIFLEYCAGGSIHSLLEKFGAFNEALSRTYITMVLEGLAYLHARQIMHRDVKGANVLVDAEGVCKLADFGASKILQQDLMSSDGARSLRGTPYWMAPEVIKQTGHSFPADVWSVGCVLVEMLTGKPPWSNFSSQISALFHIASAKAPPPLPSGISPSAVDFLLLTFKRSPRERPQASYLLKHAFVRDERPAQRRLSGPVSQVVSQAQTGESEAHAVSGKEVFFSSHYRPTPSRTHEVGAKGASQPQPGQFSGGHGGGGLSEVGPSSAAPHVPSREPLGGCAGRTASTSTTAAAAAPASPPPDPTKSTVAPLPPSVYGDTFQRHDGAPSCQPDLHGGGGGAGGGKQRLEPSPSAGRGGAVPNYTTSRLPLKPSRSPVGPSAGAPWSAAAGPSTTERQYQKEQKLQLEQEGG